MLYIRAISPAPVLASSVAFNEVYSNGNHGEGT